MAPGLTLELPGWTKKAVSFKASFPRDRDKVALAVRLSELNVLHGSGGPFGAAVFEEPGGRLISIGVNAVMHNGSSLAHAEVMALGLAQRRLRRHRLRGPAGRRYVLASSAQPCAMCRGAVLWAGIDELLFAAFKSDVERLAGFDEGPLDKDWRRELRRRGIGVGSGILRDAACRVLRRYKAGGGPFY